MPLIPAPPMPTKWTRLTLCFIAASPARCRRRRRAPRRRGARPCARRSPSRAALRACTQRDASASASGVSSACGHHRRGARVDQEPRVRALLVGDRAGQRHDDRADADRGELGDRHRAAAADDEVGLRVARGHVVDERDAFGVDARVARTRRAARRRAARRPDGRRAAAPRAGCSASASGTRSFSAAAPRLPPTTSSASGPARPAKRTSGGGTPRDRVAQRIADPVDLAPRGGRANAPGKPGQDAIGAEGEHAVREPRDGVRVVQHERLRRARRPSARRETTRSRRSPARRPARGAG